MGGVYSIAMVYMREVGGQPVVDFYYFTDHIQRFWEQEARFAVVVCDSVSLCSLGWPVSQAGLEFTDILRSLPPSYLD